jgi:hypothetical protein
MPQAILEFRTKLDSGDAMKEEIQEQFRTACILVNDLFLPNPLVGINSSRSTGNGK